MTYRIPNHRLRDVAVLAMARLGRTLTRIENKGTAMIYRTPNNETVRLRTSNDHILVVLASADDENASLNIEGTDLLLIAMLRNEREEGPVDLYLVPTDIAVSEARRTHAAWKASNPNTKGNNRTWNLWFNKHSKSGGYAQKWRQYLLDVEVSTSDVPADVPSARPQHMPMSEPANYIAAKRGEIAAFFGVSVDAVSININFAQ